MIQTPSRLNLSTSTWQINTRILIPSVLQLKALKELLSIILFSKQKFLLPYINVKLENCSVKNGTLNWSWTFNTYPYIKVTWCLSVVVYRRISLTALPIWFSFTMHTHTHILLLCRKISLTLFILVECWDKSCSNTDISN